MLLEGAFTVVQPMFIEKVL